MKQANFPYLNVDDAWEPGKCEFCPLYCDNNLHIVFDENGQRQVCYKGRCILGYYREDCKLTQKEA